MNHRMHTALGEIWQNWTSSNLYCVRPLVSFFANKHSTQSLPICETSYTGFPTNNELNTRSACLSTSAEETRRLLTSLRCCILWFLPRYTTFVLSSRKYTTSIFLRHDLSGPRSFSVCRTLWNSLLFSVYDTASLNIGTFKKVLKTILFSRISNTVRLGKICLFMSCTGVFVMVLPQRGVYEIYLTLRYITLHHFYPLCITRINGFLYFQDSKPRCQRISQWPQNNCSATFARRRWSSDLFQEYHVYHDEVPASDLCRLRREWWRKL